MSPFSKVIKKLSSWTQFLYKHKADGGKNGRLQLNDVRVAQPAKQLIFSQNQLPLLWSVGRHLSRKRLGAAAILTLSYHAKTASVK